MSAKDDAADRELDLIEDEVISVVRKSKQEIKKVKPKRRKVNVNKETFNKAKSVHKTEISKHRKARFNSHVKVWQTIFKEVGVRRRASKSIRKHKLLKKQAKTLYKLSKA